MSRQADVERIEALIRQGIPAIVIAERLGISKKTVHLWKSKMKRESKGE